MIVSSRTFNCPAETWQAVQFLLDGSVIPAAFFDIDRQRPNGFAGFFHLADQRVDLGGQLCFPLGLNGLRVPGGGEIVLDSAAAGGCGFGGSGDPIELLGQFTARHRLALHGPAGSRAAALLHLPELHAGAAVNASLDSRNSSANF